LRQARAAVWIALLALLIAIIALIYAAWYTPGLTKALNRLTDQVERMENR
jgi:HAMP domain-containing protein